MSFFIDKTNFFERFASFENKYIDTTLLAPYFKRYDGRLRFENSKFAVDQYQVDPSFVGKYNEIAQIVQNQETPNFPFRIFVTFVIDDCGKNTSGGEGNTKGGGNFGGDGNTSVGDGNTKGGDGNTSVGDGNTSVGGGENTSVSGDGNTSGNGSENTSGDDGVGNTSGKASCPPTDGSTTCHHATEILTINSTSARDFSSIRAHILTFEIWICSVLFNKHFELHGTFPFELYITTSMNSMHFNDGIYDFDRNMSRPVLDRSGPTAHELSTQIVQKCKLSNWNLCCPLLPHQRQSLEWMQGLENSIYQQSAFITFNTKTIPILRTGYCFHRQLGVITPVNDSGNTDDQSDRLSVPFKGGILADVTGSGKTAVALGLVSLTSCGEMSFNPHDRLTTKAEKQIYFCSQATLVVTPDNLIHQWKSEIQKFLHPSSSSSSLKIICISNMREFKKARLCDLLGANIVLTTDAFLKSKRYTQDLSQHTSALVRHLSHQNTDGTHHCPSHTDRAPVVNKTTRDFERNIAWRMTVSNFKKNKDDSIRSIPIESIKWHRIIIDEIHSFVCDDQKNNNNSALFSLQGCFHWGLTGSPMLQNASIFQNYVHFLCLHAQKYLHFSEFTRTFVHTCFHRFHALELGPIECRLHIINQSNREKQLLMSSQHGLSSEKQIQLCSYFNAIETGDVHVEFAQIDDLIKSSKKEKRNKLREIKSKIKYLELGIASVVAQIKQSNEDMKQFNEQNLSKTLTFSDSPPATEPVGEIHLIDVTTESNAIDDMRDIIRGRQSRLARMLKRKKEYLQEKQFIEKSVDFFETTIDTIKSSSIHNCPICLTERPNVITHCGHVFCRGCIVRCLKQCNLCPVCKSVVKPSDAHEISKNDENQQLTSNVNIYGSKFAHVLHLVKSIVAQGEQVVLFVQWPSLITVLRNMFRKFDIQFGILKNNMNQFQYHKVLHQFKQGTLNVLICMVNITGLDLTNANHLIFTHALFDDEYVVQSMEEQAIARIHRMGQTKPVHVYWFITRDTIEEKTYLQTRRHSLNPVSNLLPYIVK